MRFKPSNRSGLRKEDSLRIKIRYYNDGHMETHCECKEDGKWKTVAMMFGAKKPTWDELHKFLYVGKGNRCRMAPEPIQAVLRHMQYVEHCFGIDDDRKKRLAK